jgi:hypothetical protein
MSADNGLTEAVIEDLRKKWQSNPAMPFAQRVAFSNICDAAREALAARSVPEGWQNGERELALRWMERLLATLSTTPDHADDCLWLERLHALVLSSSPSPPGADNAQVAPAEPAEGEAVAWLIERQPVGHDPDRRPRWWRTSGLSIRVLDATSPHEWTLDANEAVRFSRREDADAVAKALNTWATNIIATEHVFL